MQQLAEDISLLLSDYHCDMTGADAFSMTPQHVLTWVNQFEEADRSFILEEFFYLLKKGIYISKPRAQTLLYRRIENLATQYRFANTRSFLENVVFLKTQPQGKSQSALLEILDNLLQSNIQMNLSQCGSVAQKYFIYLDDIVATGGTAFSHILKWLNEVDTDGKTNLQYVLDNEKVLIISTFCLHTWALLMRWRWKLELGNDAIMKKVIFKFNYEIENNPSFFNQKFNFAYPCAPQPPLVTDYFSGLTVVNKEEYAYRPSSKPVTETFYSSPENRVRFENILLYKGVELLNAATTLKSNHRPLGMVSPSYKTFGTGTLFFTWRNISNTCPIVFWWKAAGWHPLFPLYNRGLGGLRFGT